MGDIVFIKEINCRAGWLRAFFLLIASPINPEPGCRFAVRCPYAIETCKQPQKLEEIEPGHFVACCRAREIN